MMMMPVVSIIARTILATATAPAMTAPATQASTFERAREASTRLFGPTFEHTSLYGWMGLLAGILLGLVLGRIASAILLSSATRFAERGWTIRSDALKHIAAPAGLTVSALGLAFGLRMIYFDAHVREFSNKVIALLLIVAMGWALYNLVALIDVVIRRVLRRTDPKLVETVVALVRKALRIFLLVMVGLFIIQNIFGAEITPWLAGLGLAGLAVSLAAQDPIKNIFGSFTLLAERPFVLGDRVIFGDIDGTVEEIGFRSTRIRTLLGHLVTVPNMKFTDSTIENITRRPSVRRIMNITITYDTAPEKVKQAVQIVTRILEEADVKAGLNLPDQPPRVFFNEFNAESLNIFVIYWYAINRFGGEWWAYQSHSEMVNMKVLTAFNDAGIDFAFPSRTVYLAGDSKRDLKLQTQRVKESAS